MDFVSIAIYVAVAALGWWARQKGILAPKSAPKVDPMAPLFQPLPADAAAPVVHRVTLSVPFEITLTPKEK